MLNSVQIVKNKRDYFHTHSTKSLAYRLAQLNKLKQVLEDNEEALCIAIFNDFGKSKQETLITELWAITSEINVALKTLKRWAKFRRVKNNLMNFPGKSYIVPEPLGVSLVIGAWNFPYHLSLLPVVGSMMAGNTTILKPSELSPQTSALMAKLINENFDAHYLHVIEGGVKETEELLQARFDKVFFTGSPAVGKIINQAVAGNLTNITLELGGKNPAIVSKHATLGISAKRLVWGKYLNAGQLCVAPDYVLVHQSIKDEFLQCVVAEIKKYRYDPEHQNTVQIINVKNLERLAKIVDTDKIYYGGNINREKRCIEPTILHDVTLDDAVMQEEIFGPILPILTYDNLDEAFTVINRFEKPMQDICFQTIH